MVLLVAIFLLIGVPASLLYLGRFIVANTDKRAYAAMQSLGIVNDHLTSCHRHGQV